MTMRRSYWLVDSSARTNNIDGPKLFLGDIKHSDQMLPVPNCFHERRLQDSVGRITVCLLEDRLCARMGGIGMFQNKISRLRAKCQIGKEDITMLSQEFFGERKVDARSMH